MMSGIHRRPVRIGQAMEEVLQSVDLEGIWKQMSIARLWKEVVGPIISRRTKPESLRKGQLQVRVSDPVWLHQLSMMKSRIISQLNERMGEELVKEIHLRIGKVTPGENDTP